jgi:glucosamine-6-phosphate deaminase
MFPSSACRAIPKTRLSLPTDALIRGVANATACTINFHQFAGGIVILKIFNDKTSLSQAAAKQAAAAIRRAIHDCGQARVVAATGTSQLEFLDALTKAPGIDWPRVELFHLDEYIGLPITHPASFRKILMEQLIKKAGITNHHLIDGDTGDPRAVIRQVGAQLALSPIDVAFVGIGENGHVAFNDPPADFEMEDPYLIVNLDEACREQQVGEGWFADISEVPVRAISMSPRQILKATEIVAVVPEKRKAQAVKACFEGEISPLLPASILRRHANTTVYLDRASASLLSPGARSVLVEESGAVK